MSDRSWKNLLIKTIEAGQSAVELAKGVTSEECLSNRKANYSIAFAAHLFIEKVKELRGEIEKKYPSIKWEGMNLCLAEENFYYPHLLQDNYLRIVQNTIPICLKHFYSILENETPHFKLQPYSIRLTEEEAYSVFYFLEHSYGYEVSPRSDEEYLKVMEDFFKSMPDEINSDDDLLSWNNKAFGSNDDITLGVIESFKCAIEDTKAHLADASPERLKKNYEERGTDSIYENYPTEDLLLLPKEQFVEAFKLRDEALEALRRIDEMLAKVYLKSGEDRGRKFLNDCSYFRNIIDIQDFFSS